VRLCIWMELLMIYLVLGHWLKISITLAKVPQALMLLLLKGSSILVIHLQLRGESHQQWLKIGPLQSLGQTLQNK